MKIAQGSAVRHGQLPPETEAEFQKRVLQLARIRGWTIYHTKFSFGSNAGFPDLVLVRDRILYRELKSEAGQATGKQLLWLDWLSEAGGDAALWKPSDWDRIVQELT